MGAALAAVFLLLLLVGTLVRHVLSSPNINWAMFSWNWGYHFVCRRRRQENRQSTSRAGAFICLGLGAFNMDAARLDLWGDDCALKTNHQRAI
jgi:hypothetical protein